MCIQVEGMDFGVDVYLVRLAKFDLVELDLQNMVDKQHNWQLGPCQLGTYDLVRQAACKYQIK